MARHDFTTATVVDTCPRCGTHGQQLARYDHRDNPGPEHRLCYRCGHTWDLL